LCVKCIKLANAYSATAPASVESLRQFISGLSHASSARAAA
jgi:hypothetical protein